MFQIDKSQLQQVQFVKTLFENLETMLDGGKQFPPSVAKAVLNCNTELGQFIYACEESKEFVSNFYNGELEAFLKVEGDEGIDKETEYEATIEKNSQNGEYDLTICTKGHDSSLVESFSNYLDEDEAKEDLAELQRLGYKIEEA